MSTIIEKPHWSTLPLEFQSQHLLVKQLHSGGQGVAFLCKSSSASSGDQILYVCKVFFHDEKDAAYSSRCYRETVALQFIKSSSIPNEIKLCIPDIITTNITIKNYKKNVCKYFVSNYVNSQSLENAMSAYQHGISFDLAVSFTFKLLGILKQLHLNGLLHRDIKPNNIILKSNNDFSDFILIDFGLTYQRDNSELNEDWERMDQEDITKFSSGLTNNFYQLPEMSMGSPVFNSGESVVELRRDPRIDVSQACAIFFYLLTGSKPSKPISDKDETTILSRLAVLKRRVSDATIGKLHELFQSGLSYSPQDRIQNVDQFGKKLEFLLDLEKGELLHSENVVKMLNNLAIDKKDGYSSSKGTNPFLKAQNIIKDLKNTVENDFVMEFEPKTAGGSTSGNMKFHSCKLMTEDNTFFITFGMELLGDNMKIWLTKDERFEKCHQSLLITYSIKEKRKFAIAPNTFFLSLLEIMKTQ